MKKIIFFANIISMLFVFGSCEDKLDLRPYQSLDEAIVLTTDANVKSVLIGAYAAFKNDYIHGGIILRNSELIAAGDEIQWQGTYNEPREIYNHDIIAANRDVTEQWMRSYNCINICNNVLSALEVVDEDDRGQVEGEALFLRSLMYFDLVRFYGQVYEPGQNNTQLGVPLILTPTRGITDDNKIGRNTVEEVYNQVITDLTRAATLLPSANGFYATSGAANALLARVYLQKGDYTNARDRANTVIGSGLYTLMPTYDAAFNRTSYSTEDIFATKFTSADGVNPMTEFWSTTQYGGRDGDIEILNTHLNLYDASDARLALFWVGNGGYRSGKWNTQYGIVNHFRLAEMYLIRAEANQREGTTVGATPLDDYNAIHTRAGLTAATAITLDDILYERRLELAHEGFRFHDVKRLKLTVGGFAWNDNKMLFPIPARELEANPILKDQQNPGY
jgi:starch-binding outer membrane protein, SusD/RagB family